MVSGEWQAGGWDRGNREILKVCLEISDSRQSPRSVDESDTGEAVE
jgi:hypothetical protein